MRDLTQMAASRGLAAQAETLGKYLLPCIGFSLRQHASSEVGASRLGGGPDLPAGVQTPRYDGRELDFLLQVNLRDVAHLECSTPLPSDGLLAFFYDLKEQPWGFDPKDLGGSRVLYFPNITELERRAAPDPDHALPEHGIDFWRARSLPEHGSRAASRLFNDLHQTMEEGVDSSDFYDAFRGLAQEVFRQHAPESEGPAHRLGGHSDNVQGDMQLEAQLVTNGLYCGDATGYADPRAKVLEDSCEEWKLLLQLDSDDDAEFMWGDSGMLYYWIREGDARTRDFSRTWMALQCC